MTTTKSTRIHPAQQILLPGPTMAAHTVTISANTTLPSGQDIKISEEISGDGSGTLQVLNHLQNNFRRWYPFVGEEIRIDFGKGPILRVLNEAWGEYSLV